MLIGLTATLAQAADADAARTLFQQQAQPPCALCHSLRAAGASGNIGPDLDQLKPSAEQVQAALRGGLGVMPSYADSLSDEQIALLANYVSQVAGQ
ncbi:SorU family sulfite dehydrogenase c-type cytochrome subunit [Pseudomonas sp. MBLB4136]|uniref:SorU family sulfite dehydrogenase c-type cytochrome subunit n=1 Tax=Pseudomonas sp. MBLB4136 TaxID=3451558 RepID=UPI003F751FBC